MLGRRVNRWHTMGELREDMDRFFDSILGEALGSGNGGIQPARGYPPLNIWEDEQSLFVEAELPGMKMDDVEVVVVGNELTIRGQRRSEQADGNVYHRRERGVGVFSRLLRLPVEIEAEKVRAALRDGVLLVTLPKAVKARPRKVDVRVLENK